MGLGLAIARSMVEAHGGQLWATSQEGVGTTVHFTLPIAGEASNDTTEHDGVIVEFDGGRSSRVGPDGGCVPAKRRRIHGDSSEEHTSELQSLMRTSYAVFCLTKKNHITLQPTT